LIDELKNQDSLQISNLRDWAKNFEFKFRTKFSNQNEIANKIRNKAGKKSFHQPNGQNFDKSLRNISSATEFKTENIRENSTVTFNFDTVNSNLSLNKSSIPFIRIGNHTSYLSTPTTEKRNLSISSSNKSSTLNSKEILPIDQQNRKLTSKNNRGGGLTFLSAKSMSSRSQSKNEIQLLELYNEKSSSSEKGIRFVLTPSDSPIFQPKGYANKYNIYHSFVSFLANRFFIIIKIKNLGLKIKLD